jgi:hypothetical protein
VSSQAEVAVFASLVAPIVDRIAISVHNAIDKEKIAALRGDNRFHPGVLALMAGPLAGGPITPVEISELMRYEHFGAAEPFLVGLIDRGAITRDADGSITATSAGCDVAKQVVALQVETVEKLFAPRQRSLALLRSLTDRAKTAAVNDPSSALSRYAARAWLPADASDGAHIWNNTVVLRMHRSDAHAQAWKAQGHSAADIRAMSAGPARDAIEQRTNELAGVPWVPLHSDERWQLLAGLGALPGTGSPI